MPSNLFQNKEYESTKRVNTLPFRSSYIPFSIHQDFEFIHHIIDKNKSKLLIDLNGTWEFKEHKSFNSISDISELLPDTIEVPGCVQMFGYDYFQYTNILYPFPFNPPFVPEDNPLFHYRKKIKLSPKDDSFFLNFEGVDSAFYLYVNGAFVGFSQITHSHSEFDITPYVIPGENVIDVLVLKWCASSYLEDQDKFRFSGIIRDVYILKRKHTHIRDYRIEPIYKYGKWSIVVTNLCEESFSCVFGKKVKIALPGRKVSFDIDHPKTWTAENPYLYSIILQDENEKILERIGLRRVEIKDGIFLLNGKPIKLKGVNRHESSPFHGSAVTLDETVQDLKLIKSINANAIRTSHYPDRYEFYELCDVMGIYVLDEADIETHGANIKDDKWDFAAWQQFADSGLYDEAGYDRLVSLYERDKNRTCVIIFSLGNESSYGKMFHAGADYIHSHDNRPIHYEGIHNLADRSDYYTSRIDICSRMYPTLESIKHDYLEDEQEKRPLLLCEYTHAMGNSCGDAADYWKLISEQPRIIGAFVWEWCDHAVIVDGKLKYGSDFPEHYNDGNFCVDGLVTPYRQFKSSTKEIAAIYGGKLSPDEPKYHKRPILEKGYLPITNCRFDDENGTVVGLYVAGRNILKEPLTLCHLRAPIDNDVPDREDQRKRKQMNWTVTNVAHQENKHEFEYALKESDTTYLTAKLCVEIYERRVEISVSYRVVEEPRPYRLGIQFALVKHREFIYEGYGPDESYIDKHIHSQYGKFEVKVSDNLDNYLKPQESGSRYCVSYMEIGSMKVDADDPFSFNVQPYSIDQLSTAMHDYDLQEEGKSFINLDVAMAGVGSHACGPALAKEYQIRDEGHNRFILRFKNK